MFNIARKYGMRLNLLKCTFGVRAGKFLGFVVHQRGIERAQEAMLEGDRSSMEMLLNKLAGRVNCAEQIRVEFER